MTKDHQSEFDRRGWQVPTFVEETLAQRRTPYVIVIPVINEGERIRRQLTQMHDLGITTKIDTVVVDGGSTDGSVEPAFLSQVGVRALITKKGPGKLSAQLRCGYSWALLEGYEGIITIDGNGKDAVDTLPNFATALDDGYGYVQASRFIRGGHSANTPWLRLVAIRLLHAPLLSLAARATFTDTTQGYRAYSRAYLLHEAVQPFRDVFQRYELLAYLTVRASQLGFRVGELPTSRVYAKGEKIATKITGFMPLVDLLLVVWRTMRGGYHPTKSP